MKRDEKQLSIREKICIVTNKYLATADQWTSSQMIQQHTQYVVDQLLELANIKKKPAKQPQSEDEEVKSKPDFEQQVVREIRKFNEAREKMRVVQEAEIKELKSMKEISLNQIQVFNKLKDKITGVH